MAEAAKVEVGSYVSYVRAIPEEAEWVFQVMALMEESEGVWVMLVPEDEEAPDVEVAPGVMGGLGGWERCKEFKVVSAP